MGRLKEYRPAMGKQPRSTGSLAFKADGRRVKRQPLAELYSTARWQAVVERIKLRDGMTCRRTGVLLLGEFPAGDSPVVDHREPHRGDEALFWDEDNLELVSKEYHDKVKQGLEKRGFL